MFVDTHCHLNMMVKKRSDTLLTKNDFLDIDKILEESGEKGVSKIITIGTSLIESFDVSTADNVTKLDSLAFMTGQQLYATR